MRWRKCKRCWRCWWWWRKGNWHRHCTTPTRRLRRLRALEHYDSGLWWRLPCQVQHQRIHPVVHGLQGVLDPLLQLGFVRLCGCYAILSNEEFASIVRSRAAASFILAAASVAGSNMLPSCIGCRLNRASRELRGATSSGGTRMMRYGNRGLKLQASTWRRTSWREGRGGKRA